MELKATKTFGDNDVEEQERLATGTSRQCRLPLKKVGKEEVDERVIKFEGKCEKGRGLWDCVDPSLRGVYRGCQDSLGHRVKGHLRTDQKSYLLTAEIKNRVVRALIFSQLPNVHRCVKLTRTSDWAQLINTSSGRSFLNDNDPLKYLPVDSVPSLSEKLLAKSWKT